MAMNNIVTDGIIIKRINYAEADRILTIYTKALGKISAIAKGSHKPTSRKSGHLEVGNVINFELVPGKDLYIITHAKTKVYNEFADLSVMRLLFLWLEIIDKLIHDAESNERVYQIVLKGLEAICSSEKRNRLCMYELELYSTNGYQLEVQHCVVGREPLQQGENFIDLTLGGIVCPNHRNGSSGIKVSPSMIKLLRLVQASELDMLERIKFSGNLVMELDQVAMLQRHQIIQQKMRVEI